MPAAVALLAVLAIGQQIPSTTDTVKIAKKDFYAVSTTTPVFKGNRLASYASQQLAAINKKGAAAWLNDVFPANQPSEKPRLLNTYESTPTITFASPNVISMYFTVFTFTGGAHPMTIFDPHTYAMVNGQPKEILAKDVFKAPNYADEVSMQIIGKLFNNEAAMWVQTGEVKSLTPGQQNSFVVKKTGLTYLFNPYDMGPYSSGSFEVELTWADLKNIIDGNGPLKSVLK